MMIQKPPAVIARLDGDRFTDTVFANIASGRF
jgi:hypothetical protein